MNLEEFLIFVGRQSYLFIHQQHIKNLLSNIDIGSIENKYLYLLEAILYELNIDYSNNSRLCRIRNEVEMDTTIKYKCWQINTFNLKRFKQKLVNMFILSKQNEISNIIDNLSFDYSLELYPRNCSDGPILFTLVQLDPYTLYQFSFDLGKVNIKNINKLVNRHYNYIIINNINFIKDLDIIIKEGIVIDYTIVRLPTDMSFLFLMTIYDKNINLGKILFEYLEDQLALYNMLVKKSSYVSFKFYNFVSNLITDKVKRVDQV